MKRAGDDSPAHKFKLPYMDQVRGDIYNPLHKHYIKLKEKKNPNSNEGGKKYPWV